MKSILKKIKSFSLLAVIGVILLQSYLLMYGCSNTTNRPVNTESRSVYASKCGSCHRLLPPQDHSTERWRHYVDKYGKKMTQTEKQIVLGYLEQYAADAQSRQQGL